MKKMIKILKGLPAVCFLFNRSYDTHFLQKHKYLELYLMERLHVNFYLTCKRKVEQAVIQKLRNQPVIKLAFVVPVIQTWLGDEILNVFCRDDRFDVSVIVCTLDNGSEAFQKIEFKRVQDYFKAHNVKCYLLGRDEKDWEATGMPDICFYTSPYVENLPHAINLMYIPLTTLSVYVGYGYMLAHIEEMQFNQPIHNMLWRHYIHSPAYLEMAKEFSDIQGQNMVFSGYPKMDRMYAKSGVGAADEKIEWKQSHEGEKRIIRIIYAPHHSIRNAVPRFGTFDMNYRQIYEMACNSADTTSWIIKPHPVLRKTVESEGLMSVAEYDAYMAQWEALPNAHVIEDGEYLRWFASSDCIILDSVSFLAEYLFTGKPIFFINRGNVSFNRLGAMLQDVIYQIDASNTSKLQEQMTRLLNEDPLKRKRMDFFKKYIDYVELNGKLAYQFIYEDIREQLIGD